MTKVIPEPILTHLAKLGLCLGIIAVAGTIIALTLCDLTLLCLTLVICLLLFAKIMEIYRLVKEEKYEVLECRVLSDRNIPLQHKHRVVAADSERDEFNVIMEGSHRLKDGCWYRLYLTPEEKPEITLPAVLVSARVLIGYEEFQP